jgi:hypothetical protein
MVSKEELIRHILYYIYTLKYSDQGKKMKPGILYGTYLGEEGEGEGVDQEEGAEHQKRAWHSPLHQPGSTPAQLCGALSHKP